MLAGGKLVGIVTQTDLGERPHNLAPNLLLKDIMTPHPVTVSPQASLPYVLDLLNRLKISRIPVTEGSKLLGIITRGDIIRAESERLSGQSQELGPVATPSCGIYRTRAPAIGQGRLLVPLSDPDTAPGLLAVAIAIARDLNYELECLHVIVVPRSVSPEEAPADLKPGKALLACAEELAQRAEVPLHTQIRIAHEVAPTLLEVIKKRHIDMAVVGWRRVTLTPGRILGNVVDTLLRQAPCPVVALRPGANQYFNRWFLPSAGGPNSRLALQLLPALMTLGTSPSLHVCAIAPTVATKATLRTQLLQQAQALEAKLNTPIKTRLLVQENVAGAIIRLSQRYHSDVVVLGASREGLFSHVIKGNIPLEVIQHSDATILLVQAFTTDNSLPSSLLNPLETSTPS